MIRETRYLTSNIGFKKHDIGPFYDDTFSSKKLQNSNFAILTLKAAMIITNILTA